MLHSSDPNIDTEALESDIRRQIAAHHDDPAYMRAVSKLTEVSTRANTRMPRLAETMILPGSHRKGITGRLADRVLGKLFLATRLFMSGSLDAQDRINQEVHHSLDTIQERVTPVFRKELARFHSDLADLSLRRGDEDTAYHHLLLCLAYDPEQPGPVNTIITLYKKRSKPYLPHAHSRTK